MRTGLRVLVFLIGIVLIGFGLLIIAGSIVDLTDGKESDISLGGTIALVFLMGVIPTGGGFWLCRRSVKAPRARRESTDELENKILRLAKKRNGSLTPLELAMETSLSVEEAKQQLESWANQGVVTIKISESGALIYHFTGMVSEQERQSAQGVYDYE